MNGAPNITPAISGIELRELAPHGDARGSLTELFRKEWNTAEEMVQWNVVHSNAGVLRGVHVHHTHDDYLTAISGRVIVGLADLRIESDSYGVTACVELDASRPRAIAIPHGVAHGFFFPEPAIHVYGVSHYWNLDDELGCRWDDPELAIPWPQTTADISDRDAALPSTAELVVQLQAVSAAG
jgi:dTDP-4-dehydrorhamnose 3,5-epimerase